MTDVLNNSSDRRPREVINYKYFTAADESYSFGFDFACTGSHLKDRCDRY